MKSLLQIKCPKKTCVFTSTLPVPAQTTQDKEVFSTGFGGSETCLFFLAVLFR